MIFKKFKNKDRGWFRFKTFREWNVEAQKCNGKWLASFLIVGKYTFWLFRNKGVYYDWPSAA